jgi:hypothetical protein
MHSATVAENIKEICPLPIIWELKHFSAINWYYCLDLPGALHVGAKVRERQYYYLV